MKNSSYHYKKPTKFKGQGKSGAAKIRRAANKRKTKKKKKKLNQPGFFLVGFFFLGGGAHKPQAVIIYDDLSKEKINLCLTFNPILC